VLGLIPLDDRPCNRLFPTQLAPIVGCELLMPPRELLGWFTRPGECDALADWLFRCPAERLVVSVDMICYGGLVASRTPTVEAGLAISRLEHLRALRRERPHLTIFAFSNIMRLGTTVTAAETLQLHQDLFAYSKLVDEAARLGDEAARHELDAVLARLDPAAVADYLVVRKRNHALNRAAVGLLAEGVLDYLVLSQEDAAPVGLHIPELLALQGEIAQAGAGERAALHPGADEVGLVLMARQLLSAMGSAPRIAPDYATAAGADTVPLYEHQPLRQTVESHLRAARAELVPPGQAEAIMFLHTPLGPQQEASEAPPTGQSPGLALQAESVVDRLQAARSAGYLVGLADVAYANGADPELVAALQRAGAAPALHAFAGWNTSANTIGTVIAQLCLGLLASRAREGNPDAPARFATCRFLDDYAYQSRVRPRAIAHAESRGANPFALGGAAPEMERYVRQELLPLAHSMSSDLLSELPLATWGELQVSLPWQRLFEVEVEFVPSA